jgi:hypothetical protein
LNRLLNWGQWSLPEQHGMILGLRVFPRVLPGDALAVVLEIAPP